MEGVVVKRECSDEIVSQNTFHCILNTIPKIEYDSVGSLISNEDVSNELESNEDVSNELESNEDVSKSIEDVINELESNEDVSNELEIDEYVSKSNEDVSKSIEDVINELESNCDSTTDGEESKRIPDEQITTKLSVRNCYVSLKRLDAFAVPNRFQKLNQRKKLELLIGRTEPTMNDLQTMDQVEEARISEGVKINPRKSSLQATQRIKSQIQRKQSSGKVPHKFIKIRNISSNKSNGNNTESIATPISQKAPGKVDRKRKYSILTYQKNNQLCVRYFKPQTQQPNYVGNSNMKDKNKKEISQENNNKTSQPSRRIGRLKQSEYRPRKVGRPRKNTPSTLHNKDHSTNIHSQANKICNLKVKIKSKIHTNAKFKHSKKVGQSTKKTQLSRDESISTVANRVKIHPRKAAIVSLSTIKVINNNEQIEDEALFAAVTSSFSNKTDNVMTGNNQNYEISISDSNEITATSVKNNISKSTPLNTRNKNAVRKNLHQVGSKLDCKKTKKTDIRTQLKFRSRNIQRETRSHKTLSGIIERVRMNPRPCRRQTLDFLKKICMRERKNVKEKILQTKKPKTECKKRKEPIEVQAQAINIQRVRIDPNMPVLEKEIDLTPKASEERQCDPNLEYQEVQPFRNISPPSEFSLRCDKCHHPISSSSKNSSKKPTVKIVLRRTETWTVVK